MHDAIIHLGLLDDEDITLDSAALQLAALDHPGIDLAAHVAWLGEITERVGVLGQGAQSAAARAAVLARVIAGEEGFAGDRERYDDPDNADLIRVLDRRCGLPVSLAILYVSTARRLGWAADVLNTPGHVLVRIGPDPAPVLIDAFDDGEIVSPERLADLLSRMLGQETAPSAEHLAPMTNRAVLVRLLMNQAGRAEAGGQILRARTLFERMTIVAPANVHSWWERARLELMTRDVAAARASLSAMLEMTRDPALRAHISATLDGIAGANGAAN